MCKVYKLFCYCCKQVIAVNEREICEDKDCKRYKVLANVGELCMECIEDGCRFQETERNDTYGGHKECDDSKLPSEFFEDK